jgi:hypothetical protein
MLQGNGDQLTPAPPTCRIAITSISNSFLIALKVLADLDDETFDIGSDTRTPVDDSYELPFHFTGTINKLTFKLGPEQLMAEDHAAKAEALASVHS